VLFVGSMDGFFYALDAADGSLVWKFESGYKLWNRLPYGGVRATPIIVDGKIIFGG
jgi:outer membrane protein assembly factor BamB